MLDSNLKQIIEELYAIPNAPYSILKRSQYVKEKISNASLQYSDNEYYIYTKLNSGNGRKIIFMSHLDHPGFVFKNSKEAKAFGSLYLDRVKKLKPVSVYNPDGKYLGDVQITKVFGKDENKIEVSSNFNIPRNSQGLWNVGDIKFENDKVYGRSHDNDIVTSILLNNLKKVESEYFEIIFVFTKHEEILQQSSYAFANENSLNINKDDIIINLESMKVYSTTDNPLYSKLDYESGVVLNISEATCIYGQQFSGRNIAESLINNITTNNGIDIQRGMAGGTSDSRLISTFALTPNIVTLNIPNKYKHNSNEEEIVNEEVRNSDVLKLDAIIKCIFESAERNLTQNQLDISEKVKIEFPEFGNDLSSGYLKINKRLHIANRAIIQRSHYYPEDLIEFISDFYLKILSYFKYFSTTRKTIKVSKI